MKKIENLPERFWKHKENIEVLANKHARAVVKGAWFINSPDAPDLSMEKQLKLRDERTSTEAMLIGYLEAIGAEFDEEYKDVLQEIEIEALKRSIYKYRKYKRWTVEFGL